MYVGSLKVEIEVNEQEEIAKRLLNDFNCVPTFLPHDTHKKFGLFFITCYLCALIMQIVMTDSCGGPMCLQI